jgi:cob(I)alamin adenosyltransferase
MVSNDPTKKPKTSKKTGRLLIFTGDGKGKTTAAIGLAVRACGHGQKVFILQFLKSKRPTGERLGLQYLPGIEMSLPVWDSRTLRPQPLRSSKCCGKALTTA